jgi:hypothetical protein
MDHLPDRSPYSSVGSIAIDLNLSRHDNECALAKDLQ